ncbi:hypothetical protein, partial [Rhodococcus sp. UNC363MFTsu5.1]|uniref:hypothetical protein n=1 Tax=Rhodococcus sp. UNC363MFTsu5.1 TaxID=1449069 RepID=UPI000482B81B
MVALKLNEVFTVWFCTAVVAAESNVTWKHNVSAPVVAANGRGVAIRFALPPDTRATLFAITVPPLHTVPFEVPVDTVTFNRGANADD